MCSKQTRIGQIAAFAVLAATARVAAEPLHLLSPAQCTTEKGSELKLDPGYYVSEIDWSTYDAEIRRLQDAETRLNAENKSLKDGDGMGWRTFSVVIGTTLVGMFAGSRWL